MTDSADPRIALMQKWSLENPSLMAQAGLMAQAAPVALRESSSFGADEHIGSEFLGVRPNLKNRNKKIKELNKKLAKLHGGRPGMPYMPMPAPLPHFAPRGPVYPQAYPGSFPHGYYPGAGGYGPAHHNQRPNQAHHVNPPPRKSTEDLRQELTTKLEHYKLILHEEKTHLTNTFDAIDTDIKEKAKASLRNILTLMDSTAATSAAGEETKWNSAVSYINNDILISTAHDVSSNKIRHDAVKTPDFTHIPANFIRTWGYGYLTKELIAIADKSVRASYPSTTIKTKTYYTHLKDIASKFRKNRADVQKILDEMKRAPKPVAAATAAQPARPPRTITSFSGHLTTVGGEFDSDAGTISMSNPYGL